MSQDRFTEGGRSIVWRAVQESLNAHRRNSLVESKVFLKFARTIYDWQPGEPDSGISEEDIQKLIADIAADVCKRVEETLDRVDPRTQPNQEIICQECGTQFVTTVGGVCPKCGHKWDGTTPAESDLSAADRAKRTWGGFGPGTPPPRSAEQVALEHVDRDGQVHAMDKVLRKDKYRPPAEEDKVEFEPAEPLELKIPDDCQCAHMDKPCEPCLLRAGALVESHMERINRKLDFRALEGKVLDQPEWVVWKKRVIGEKSGWMTRSEYEFTDRAEADRKAEGFKRQLTVVGVMVLPKGKHPEAQAELNQTEESQKDWRKAPEDCACAHLDGGKICPACTSQQLEDLYPGQTITGRDQIDELREALEAGARAVERIPDVDLSRTLGRPNDPPAALDEAERKLDFRMLGELAPSPTYPVADVKPWSPLDDEVPDVPTLAESMPSIGENTVSEMGTVYQPEAVGDKADPETFKEAVQAWEDGAEPLGPVSAVPRSGMNPGRPPRTYKEMIRDMEDED